MRGSSECPICSEDQVNPIWAVNPNSRRAIKPNMRVLDWTKVRLAFSGEEGEAPSLPSRMSTLLSSVEDCFVKITWEPPLLDGGARISSYQIELKSYDDSWQSLTNHCKAASQVSTNMCLIEMRILKEAPYNLKPD